MLGMSNRRKTELEDLRQLRIIMHRYSEIGEQRVMDEVWEHKVNGRNRSTAEESASEHIIRLGKSQHSMVQSNKVSENLQDNGSRGFGK